MAKATTSRGQLRLDQFGNRYSTSLITAVADTILFTEWNTGFSIKDGYGFILHKIEYLLLPGNQTNINADADNVSCGLTTRNDLTNADLLAGIKDSILDNCVIGLKVATAVGQQLWEGKFVHDFTNEPGGGRIVAPRPLYWAISSVGIGAVIAMQVKCWWTMIKLSGEIYRELYESTNPSA